MKKIYFFMMLSASAFVLNSCSGDDSQENVEPVEPSGTVTMKVDGVLKTYNTVSVQESRNSEETVFRTFDVSQNGNAAERVYFHTVENATGAAGMEYILYYTNDYNEGGLYESPANISINNGTKYKGTFSGTYITIDPDTFEEIPHTITEGNIDITYQTEYP